MGGREVDPLGPTWRLEVDVLTRRSVSISVDPQTVLRALDTANIHVEGHGTITITSLGADVLGRRLDHGVVEIRSGGTGTRTYHGDNNPVCLTINSDGTYSVQQPGIAATTHPIGFSQVMVALPAQTDVSLVPSAPVDRARRVRVLLDDGRIIQLENEPGQPLTRQSFHTGHGRGLITTMLVTVEHMREDGSGWEHCDVRGQQLEHTPEAIIKTIRAPGCGGGEEVVLDFRWSLAAEEMQARRMVAAQ